MIIHRIRLKDYRGVDSAEATFLPRGVTVIEGPNESGKSCFAEALDVVFDDLDSSVNKRIRAIQPVHRDTGPEVEVEVETGKYHFVLLKRYLKASKTELRVLRPKPQNLTGREAHERVQQMLGETLDMALWKALRIVQGNAVGQAVIPSNSSLTLALDRAAGGNPAGEQEATLFEAVEREYGGFYTQSGRERDIIKSATEGIENANKVVQDYQDKMHKIESDAKRSGELSREMKRLSDSESDQNKSRKDWEQRHLAVETAQHRLEIARAELELAVRNQSQLAENAAARTALREDLKKTADRIQRLRQEIADAASAVEAVKSEYQGLKVQTKTAEDNVAHSFDLWQVRQRDHDYLETQLNQSILRERRDRYEKALKEAEKAEKILATNKVDSKTLEKVRDADQLVRIAQAKLEQGGPALTLEPFADLTLTVNRKKMALRRAQVLERQVADTLDIVIEDVANVRVQPGTSTDRLQEDLRNAQTVLKQHLDPLGLGSLPEAVEAHRAHEEAARVLAELEETRKRDLRDLTREQLQSKLNELEGRIASHIASRPKEPPIAGDRESSKRLAGEAETLHREASEDLMRKRRRFEAATTVWEEMMKKQVEQQTRLQEAESTEADLTGRLQALRSDISDDDLTRELQDATRAKTEKQSTVAQLELELQKLDPETVESRFDSAKRLLEKIQQERGDVERTLTEVSARLRVFEEEGVFDHLQAALTGLDHAQREHNSIRTRAEAARLLFETLREARENARLNYVQPLKEAVEHLGRVVYGASFQIDIDQDLQITSRTLEGRTVPFESLSTGTKEQLSLILRLASASIAGKEGGSVPLIIDDALGYSDPERVQSMGAVLDAAGSNSQVIAMTCMPERYHYISGAKVIRLG